MSEQRDYAVRTAIHAFYSHSQLLIVAEGELPSPEFEIDIAQLTTEESGIPTFQLTRRPRPGTENSPLARTPFRYGEIFSIGRPPENVLVRHATGFDEVSVEFTRQDLVDIVLSLSAGDVEVSIPDAAQEDDVDVSRIPPPPPHAGPDAAQRSSQAGPVEQHARNERHEKRERADRNDRQLDEPVMSRPLTGSEKAGILSDIAVRYRESIGYSNKLSFDEAFADAVKKLPPASVKFPDMLETIEVVQVGASFGGIAGFHRLEVRIRAYPD